MKINCINCDREVDLDHPVFEEYQGPVKCFHCGTVMDVDIAEGLLQSASLRGDASPLVRQQWPGLVRSPGVALAGSMAPSS